MKTLLKITQKVKVTFLIFLFTILSINSGFSETSFFLNEEQEEVDEEVGPIQNNDVPNAEIILYLSVYGYVVYDIDTTLEDYERIVTVEKGGLVVVYLKGGQIVGHEDFPL